LGSSLTVRVFSISRIHRCDKQTESINHNGIRALIRATLARRRIANGNRRARHPAALRRARSRNPRHRSRHDLGDETVAAIRAAWLEHLVVFFRGQALAPAEFLRVASRFGEPVEYPFVKGLDGFPQITR
jgi:hypothetical protein